MPEYSEAELKLIKRLSDHWYNVIHKTDIHPPILYDILAREIFIYNRQGPEIEALRRVINAINKCSPYRMTPEFDELCRYQ